jgi:hypothetical protein
MIRDRDPHRQGLPTKEASQEFDCIINGVGAAVIATCCNTGFEAVIAR